MQQENHKLPRAFAMATNAPLEPIVYSRLMPVDAGEKTLPGGWTVQSIEQPVPSPDKREGLATGRASSHKTFAINRNAETVSLSHSPELETVIQINVSRYQHASILMHTHSIQES